MSTKRSFRRSTPVRLRFTRRGLTNVSRSTQGAGTGRLRATTEYEAVLETDISFLCLPTPQNENGSIDLSIMEVGAERLGETVREKEGRHTVIVKSTVVPGTTEDIIAPLV
jgi:UDPglucose 6-dehydrogenase